MVMIAQTAFNGGIVSERVRMRIDQPRYQTGVEDMLNMIPDIQGPVKRRPGLEFRGAVDTEDKEVRILPFVFSETQSYILEFGEQYMRVWYDGSLVLTDAAEIFKLATPYTASQLFSLSYVQSADIIYICHPEVAPKRLERRGHNDWAIVDVVTGTQQPAPSGLTASATGTEDKNRAYSYVVTAVNDETNEESVASVSVSVNAAEDLNASNYVTLSWSALQGVSLYNVYKDRTGSGVYGYIGSSGSTQKIIDRGEVPAVDDRPPEAKNPFEGAGNYPSTVTFFQQRLVFAGSTNNPLTVDFSQTANFQNFNVSTPVKSDDAVKITLASGQQNNIIWLYGARKLQIGTIGGEWITSGAGDEPLAPDNPDAQNIGSIGSSRLMPIYISGRTLFCQGDGHTVRELRYDYVSDSFIPSNQIVFADSLFEGKRIVDWAYQQSPYTCIWCVLDDGTVAGFTYNIEHQVSGWHRHTTDGFIESVASVPFDTYDDVYFIVRRDINGATRRFVERMRPYFDYDTENNFFFVDSGVMLDAGEGNTYTTVTGLDHLAGKSVSILTDGYVRPEITVGNDGVLNLGSKGARKIELGLPYESSVIPLTREYEGRDGSNSLLNSRTNNSIKVHYYRSIGGYYQTVSRDRRGKYVFGPKNEIISRIGNETGALEPSSGVQSLQLDASYGPRDTIKIMQVDPLPLTILAISTNVEGGTQ